MEIEENLSKKNGNRGKFERFELKTLRKKLRVDYFLKKRLLEDTNANQTRENWTSLTDMDKYELVGIIIFWALLLSPPPFSKFLGFSCFLRDFFSLVMCICTWGKYKLSGVNIHKICGIWCMIIFGILTEKNGNFEMGGGDSRRAN